MSYLDLRSFIKDLAKQGELVRISEEVDSDQEITIIQHKVLNNNGPAMLFENVKGSDYRLVTNLFGTSARVEKALGCHPAELGEKIAGLADQLMPFSLKKAWKARKDLSAVSSARMKNVSKGPILENIQSPSAINSLPCLKCWPLDGGPFFTLPLVHTVDPKTGAGNLGIYRMQRYDNNSTGMHWQIEKGGGFHFKRASEMNQPLPISVFLGGPPALTIAAITPLPEGIDERLLAAYILGKPLSVIERETTGHKIPASAEFVLEGSVVAGDERLEGPFGDHLGHYSHSANFPVFRIDRMLARDDAIYPATVVGKPPQEDFYIGMAISEMTLPLLKMIKPAITDLWAYPESGFHPLAVIKVKERYPKEAMKHALGILGEGQLSLTKVLIVTGDDCDDVRDFKKVSRSVWRNLDLDEGLHLLSPTAQDTLDFTGPSMNTGSRLILLATDKPEGPLRKVPPKAPPPPKDLHDDIKGVAQIGEAFLAVQVAKDGKIEEIRETLNRNPITKEYLFHVLVSEDVDLNDPMMLIWGWFTRFDPLMDIHPAKRELKGNKLIMSFPITIDATWKTGYRKPVEFDPDIESRVEAKWARYKIG